MISSVIILPSLEGADGLLARRSADAVETTRGTLDALLPLLSPGYAAVLPGQLVRGLSTDLPDKIKGAERLSVARFAHEDSVAGDPDALHVVVGPGNPAPTALVATEVMDDVLSALDPAILISDFDALAPLAGRDVRLLDRIVSPGPNGHALDPDWYSDISGGEPDVLDDDTLARAVFERLDSGEALDLRSGPYRRRRSVQAGPWGKVAATALVCGLLGLGVSIADARATALQASQIDYDARVLYQQQTGQAAPAQLSSLARQAAAGDAAPARFLDLSNILFKSVAATPGTQVERLSYEAREGTLRLRVLYPSFEAAAQFEASVAQMGGVLATGGVREQNGVFIGDAALSGAGS